MRLLRPRHRVAASARRYNWHKFNKIAGDHLQCQNPCVVNSVVAKSFGALHIAKVCQILSRLDSLGHYAIVPVHEINRLLAPLRNR